MTTTTTLTLGLHDAALDLASGNGWLVLPREADDLALESGTPSLHHADLLAALAELDRLGWESSEADDGGLMFEGMTEGGRRVAGLYGREPMRDGLSWEDHLEAGETLLRDVRALY